MSTAKTSQFLSQTGASLRRMQTKLVRLDSSLVEQDIAARRQEAHIGFEFARLVDRIEAALKTTGSNLSLDQWCKQRCGCDISTMRRRKRLSKKWREYEGKRRELGSCGQSGLLFALSLVSEETHTTRMNRQHLPVRSHTRTIKGASAKSVPARFDTTPCQFITGDALTELPKLHEKSVNVIITSPPYWPAKRTYGGKGIGFEKSLQDYIANLVAVFGQAKGVLRDDGILWIIIDDSYDDGNLMFIPSRLAMALQDDGWICRSEIIWNKDAAGRPENAKDRVTNYHEKVLMFTKQRRYFFDQDPIREPLVKAYSVPDNRKPGLMRNDSARGRVWANPMGRNAGSVWTIMPSNYRGNHGATMPEELARRCILVSCPENGVVLDCFGGAGTTALAALRLGRRVVSIEINPAYTRESRHRIDTELGGADDESYAVAAE